MRAKVGARVAVAVLGRDVDKGQRDEIGSLVTSVPESISKSFIAVLALDEWRLLAFSEPDCCRP